MKKSRFTYSQIAFILRQAGKGTSMEEVCRKAGISAQTCYPAGATSTAASCPRR